MMEKLRQPNNNKNKRQENNNKILMVYEISESSVDFKPFHILERFNHNRTLVEYYKFDVQKSNFRYHILADEIDSTYHEWSSSKMSARVFYATGDSKESDVFKLFAHMINKHRGENYYIRGFETYEQFIVWLNESQ